MVKLVLVFIKEETMLQIIFLRQIMLIFMPNDIFVSLSIVVSIVLMDLFSNELSVLKVLIINHVTLILTIFINLTWFIFYDSTADSY